jgi:fructokinase
MGVAGEWGHHAVWAGRSDARACYCGQRGCVEAHLAGPALEAMYAERSGARRPLAAIVARRADDPHAAAVVDELLATFGRGLANVVDVLDPSAIVLGGGLSKLDLLYDEGRDRVAAMTFTDAFDTPILRPACGDAAGVLGAALLAAR